jgi:hypothetical protein
MRKLPLAAAEVVGVLMFDWMQCKALWNQEVLSPTCPMQREIDILGAISSSVEETFKK